MYRKVMLVLADLLEARKISKPDCAIVIAVLLWSTSACCLVSLSDVPLFLLLAILLSANFMMTIVRITIKKKWCRVVVNYKLWFAGVLGLVGNDFVYYFAFRLAPPAMVELISWSWPIMLMLCLYGQRLTKMMCWSLGLGLASVVLLQQGKSFLDNAHFPQIWWGGLLAFVAAAAWTFYVLVSRQFKEAPQEMVGLYAGVGAAMAWVLHSVFEPSHSMTLHDDLLMLWLALGPITVAYYAWDYGVSFGDVGKATRLSYCIPCLSYLWLVVVGGAHFTFVLVSAFILMTISILLPLNSLSVINK